jgi:alkylation response protein AidB-like acyl-CoA dehydrogenase
VPRSEALTVESLEEFRSRAVGWLDEHADRRPPTAAGTTWGEGSDSVALFHNLTPDEEKAHIDARRQWVAKKADAGLANLSWEIEWGGAGLPLAYERVMAEEESSFVTPAGHEAISITVDLVAPTIRAYGTADQKRQLLRPMLRADTMWCQLFSEPGAGSDLAGVTTKAERDGDEWVLNGQKVWTSGAQYADWGYILCRTDVSVAKHRGLTAFVVPMTSPGVDVRPLRQITGGASFNEVFFADVRVPDALRLGDVGEGWRVALTTLGFERGGAGSGGEGAEPHALVALAQHLGRTDEPVIRQLLARAYIHQRLLALNGDRAKARSKAGEPPGPEGSIGKLFWTEGLRLTNEVASLLLGPRLVADTGEWGTFAWTEHLLGTAGYRVAAGTDEVQRNILGERVLGLPSEPRVDTKIAFRDIPRLGAD